ncbi:Aste57867_6269 [Aphanomyces stellatus]|uniref:Aste57867_6269 protein n=1 Tax=Aphanomyces stellatus TaxID=120398 RepID=A0A485KFN0_9STRA|nr:hypothetical protein As57867_006255 [Aphanomyces stellatus]VFT83268.1 Aste57867_6269 [Aphanomyces stellatus]
MTMTWTRALNPFHSRHPAKQDVKSRAKPNTLSRFFGLVKKTRFDTADRTPPCSPDTSSANQPFERALPVALFQRVRVPVQIPTEHMYQKSNIVAGKKVAYTRRQVKLAKRKVLLYETISEDKVYHNTS